MPEVMRGKEEGRGEKRGWRLEKLIAAGQSQISRAVCVELWSRDGPVWVVIDCATRTRQTYQLGFRGRRKRLD